MEKLSNLIMEVESFSKEINVKKMSGSHIENHENVEKYLNSKANAMDTVKISELINRLAIKSRLLMHNIHFSQLRKERDDSFFSIHSLISGEYIALVNFFSSLMKEDFLFVIDEFKIKKSQNNKELVDAQIHIKIYFFR